VGEQCGKTELCNTSKGGYSSVLAEMLNSADDNDTDAFVVRYGES
jgi:hypothetical protein